MDLKMRGEIHIGSCDKNEIIQDYIAEKNINKIILIGENMDIDTDVSVVHCPFADTIKYSWYYKLLGDIVPTVLIILNECLKKANRYDLTYNCIRKYCIQTPHRLIFNYYPIIREKEDFMILYDMISPNPHWKEAYRYITRFEEVYLHDYHYNLDVDNIELDISQEEYEQKKEEIISQVKKDADIIPRRLYKWVNEHKPKGYDKMDKIKPDMKVCVSQLKVDTYYLGTLESFRKELNDVTDDLRQAKNCKGV